jgi:hypothetical protein
MKCDEAGEEAQFLVCQNPPKSIRIRQSATRRLAPPRGGTARRRPGARGSVNTAATAATGRRMETNRRPPEGMRSVEAH